LVLKALHGCNCRERHPKRKYDCDSYNKSSAGSICSGISHVLPKNVLRENSRLWCWPIVSDVSFLHSIVFISAAALADVNPKSVASRIIISFFDEFNSVH